VFGRTCPHGTTSASSSRQRPHPRFCDSLRMCAGRGGPGTRLVVPAELRGQMTMTTKRSPRSRRKSVGSPPCENNVEVQGTFGHARSQAGSSRIGESVRGFSSFTNQRRATGTSPLKLRTAHRRKRDWLKRRDSTYQQTQTGPAWPFSIRRLPPAAEPGGPVGRP